VTYIVNSSGVIEVINKLKGEGELPKFLPRFKISPYFAHIFCRIGNEFIMDEQYSQAHWLGRGPHENYTGALKLPTFFLILVFR